MSVLSCSYGLVRADRFDPRYAKLVGLPRGVAHELTLLAVLAPLASSELSAPLDGAIYATDASED